ncbi:MAG: XRE family transcriptional regulator [Gammaproteobacteria bacterium]|nr:XRE family transcriptional regulator [Gammaproteobacteria bacterium]
MCPLFKPKINLSPFHTYIEKEKLTQAEAAKRLGIAQSRVSDLVRKWEKFSLEMLITLRPVWPYRAGRTGGVRTIKAQRHKGQRGRIYCLLHK